MVIQFSTLQLLRLHFSFFLLPVYLFALAITKFPDLQNSILIFFILHVLVYPSSNGYNSYMDRDQTAIGGIRCPQPPTRQLYWVTLGMDFLALLLGLKISLLFSLGLLIYILLSRAYSWRGIRLKKYPLLGYLTVTVMQGGFILLLCHTGFSTVSTPDSMVWPALSASLFIGGFYPLTQIFQHETDRKDGVITWSYVLGYRGTFLWSGSMYLLAIAALLLYFLSLGDLRPFWLFLLLLSPVGYAFLKWAFAVRHDISEANYENTMRMSLIASIYSNLAFSSLLIWKYIE